MVADSEPERSSSASDRRLGRALAIAVASVLTGGCALGSAAPADPSQADVGVVERVIDGDTVELRIAGSTETVRLIGLDAPESVARSVPDQCYGAEASAALDELLPVGSTVDLHRDVEGRDHYGRLLLYLHRSGDELFVNHWLVAEGFADAISYEPNTSHAASFARAARQARTDRRGLWGACDGPDQPLDP